VVEILGLQAPRPRDEGLGHLSLRAQIDREVIGAKLVPADRAMLRGGGLGRGVEAEGGVAKAGHFIADPLVQ
jgi:hypothetical protein